MNDRDCKMHEFTLHSATKYKDGTPMMTEPEKAYCENDVAVTQDTTSSYPLPESNQIDLFEINHFVQYLANEYPSIKVSVRYDFVYFKLRIQIEPKLYRENVEYYSGESTAYDTKTCISHINDAFIAYLAYLSHMRIKL